MQANQSPVLTLKDNGDQKRETTWQESFVSNPDKTYDAWPTAAETCHLSASLILSYHEGHLSRIPDAVIVRVISRGMMERSAIEITFQRNGFGSSPSKILFRPPMFFDPILLSLRMWQSLWVRRIPNSCSIGFRPL